MRFLFLLTQDMISPSGLGRYFPLARALGNLGHSVTIAALHSAYNNLATKTEYINDRLMVDYVAQMHVGKSESLKTYFSPLKLLWIAAKATWCLTDAARRYPVDWILVGKPHPMNGLAGVAGSINKRAKLWVDVDDDEVASGHFQKAWQKRVVHWSETKLPVRADFVTTNTFHTRERLLNSGVHSEAIYYLPNGVDRTRFRPVSPEQVTTLRKKYHIEGRKTILYVGSMSLVNHPVDLLLKAFVSLQKSIPNAVLLFVGGGEDFDNIRRMAGSLPISDQVIFTGRVPPEEVSVYYQLGDVSVDPVYDNSVARARCPLKLFESWASQIPFVTADVGDRQRLAGDPPAALLAKAGDANSMAEAIGQVLTNPELATSLRENGFQRIQSYYWDQLAPALLEYIEHGFYARTGNQNLSSFGRKA